MTLRTPHAEKLPSSVTVIERKVKELALRHGEPICSCTWNHGKGISNSGLYRLDIRVDLRVVKIYFTEHELNAYWDDRSAHETDVRLSHVISSIEDEIPPGRSPWP